MKILNDVYRMFLLVTMTGMLTAGPAQGQNTCDVLKDHGQGYTTAITSVVANDDNSYSIVLDVKHNGCSGNCKAMAHYSVEAQPGTYSDVVITLISGSFNYQNINMGPDLGNDPFTGFRINGTAGFGNGDPGEFTISYRLTGDLQDQRTLVKAGKKLLIVSFSAADFQSVLDCNSPNIFPYYEPPENGKLVNSLIGPELTSLYNFYSAGGTAVSDNIFQIDSSKVLIRVFAQPGQYANLLSLLISPSYGMTGEKGIPGLEVISGWYPIANLLMLNDLPTLINYARPEYPPQSNSGLVTSQGDVAMRADIARSAFGLQGAGVKVGVISDSYNKKFGNPANDDILKGDLPGVGIDPNGNPVANPVNDTNVEVLKDFPYAASDEGRAMLQIVHDIAPKANLAFRTGFINPLDFAAGIIELKDAGCDVIVDDVTYISEPFFSDGVVSQAVNQVKAAGVAYFTAAGNFGEKSYEAAFNPVPAPSGITGVAHNFAGSAGTDVYQSVHVDEGSYTLVLQWDDGSPAGATATDMDIYLARDDGSTLFGFNRVNTGGDAVEVLPFSVGAGGAETNILIVEASGHPDVRIKYVVFRGELSMNEYANAAGSTITGHANAEGAMTVGAVLYSNTPAYGVSPPTIASFSSRGGLTVGGTIRMKPDFSAPNGVNTTVDLGGVNYENDPFPNFFGTSAAAPHAAAVAALLIEAGHKFYDAPLNPDAVRQILQSTAIDMGAPGFDVASGFGFIQADAALLSLANPSPVISQLIYDTTLVPGTDTIPVTVTGNYFTVGSQIYFNGEPLPSGTVLPGDTAITAEIPPYSDFYPAVQVYNPPNPATNGSDGGLSDPLYFTTKQTILISIADTGKKYGEVLPEFKASSYELIGIDERMPLDSAGLMPAEINRIKSIAFEAPNVTDLSNAGLWAIKADAADPLNPASGVEATDSLDIALLNSYRFVFEDGLLNIEKMDLLIRPQDTTFVYGDSIGGIGFDYIYNDDPTTSVVIDPVVNQQILSALQLGHATALVNGKATALVNAQATALVNYSFMISATALVNNTGLIDIELEDPDALFDTTALTNGAATALVNGASITLFRATALVNGQATALVNGQATALVNAASLGHATALVNTTTINANSNSDAIIILGEQDLEILSGQAAGDITLVSMNLISDNNAGDHWLVPGTFLSNNFDVTYQSGTIHILPAPATVVFDQATLQQTYNGLPAVVGVSTDPTGLNTNVLYDGLVAVPADAGTYLISAAVNDPNYTGYAEAQLTVDPAPLTITATDVSKIYGSTDPALSFEITSGVLYGDDVLTGSLTREQGENADTYAILQGNLSAGDNYALTFTNGIFTIAPAPLTISAGTQFIFEGDPLPEFDFAFSGFVNGEDQSVLTGLTYSLSPDYNGNAGTYEVIPQAQAANYLISTGNGTLYVNPDGPGTKHIIPKLACVQMMPAGSAYAWEAHFEYENKNNVDVFIPKGEDNLLSSIGGFDDSNQPELFLAGGGAFSIPFDGTDLTWTVASYNQKGQKTSQGQTANAGSNSCTKNAEITAAADPGFDDLRLYPNPANDHLYITLTKAFEGAGAESVRIYDSYGRSFRVPVGHSGSGLLEMDVSGLRHGIYFVRIKSHSQHKILRFIRQ